MPSQSPPHLLWSGLTLMGILLEDAKNLLEVYVAEGPFQKVLTLGRQQIFFQPPELAPALKKAGVSADRITRFVSTTFDRGPADPLFEALGSSEIFSMDVSDYEGASIRHDLNQSVKSELHAQFDLVYDGGTLEHVFNFPIAIRNAMEMVKVGGFLVSVTPANNQAGHGFYQFSPELFYNVLSSSNGYAVEKMVAIEISPSHRQYLVANPTEVRGRVMFSNSWPVNLFVVAKREKNVSLFSQTPQQTDYAAIWEKSAPKSYLPTATAPSSDKISIKRRVKQASLTVAPGWIRFLTTFKRVFMDRQTEFRDSKFYRRIS